MATRLQEWTPPPVKIVKASPEAIFSGKAAIAPLEELEAERIRSESQQTQIQQLLSEIKELTEAENNLETRRQSLHIEELQLMFTIGEKILKLKQITPYGNYKKELTTVGLSWTSARRKYQAFELFGQYRHEPWITNFGKSALQEIAYYHHQKKNNRAEGLVEEAISLAQKGVEIGVAWVFSKMEGRRHEAGERRSRLSARVRKAIHLAIEKHGEEKVLEVLGGLNND